jgi:hypothetical protein
MSKRSCQLEECSLSTKQTLFQLDAPDEDRTTRQVQEIQERKTAPTIARIQLILCNGAKERHS